MKAVIHYGEMPGGKYELDKNYFIISGGIEPPPSFKEYVNDYQKNFKVYILAIKKVVEKANLLDTPANKITNDIWFELSDGHAVVFTWRGWGDLIQSIRNKREGYMAFYYN